jgi:hypothetical protein
MRTRDRRVLPPGYLVGCGGSAKLTTWRSGPARWRGSGPTRWTLLSLPHVESVDPGPPMTMLVRMLPGQSADDFQDKTELIASLMQVSEVQITPFDDGLINVVLLDHDLYSEVTPPPA